MQCRESKRVIGAFIDNEMDLMSSVALEDHLSVCSDCKEEAEQQRELQTLIQASSLRFTPPPDLKQDVLRALRLQEDESAQKTPFWRRLGFGPGLLTWKSMAAVMLLYVATVAVFLARPPAGQELANAVVENHIRSLMVNHVFDVASTDQHTVKPWFSGKLSFSPKVTDFADKGFPLTGGRLDYMDGRSVAALVYNRRQHVINVFTYPSATRFGPSVSEQQGFHVINWSDEGMEYWVVSDLNEPELREFAELLRG